MKDEEVKFYLHDCTPPATNIFLIYLKNASAYGDSLTEEVGQCDALFQNQQLPVKSGKGVQRSSLIIIKLSSLKKGAMRTRSKSRLASETDEPDQRQERELFEAGAHEADAREVSAQEAGPHEAGSEEAALDNELSRYTGAS